MLWCVTHSNDPCGIKLLINTLATGRFQRNFRKVIFQLILVIDGWSISCKIVLKWMPMDLTDGKSTLVQVMAWCRQATGYYLTQCWPKPMSPYGINRPQCVNTMRPFADSICKCIFLMENVGILTEINFIEIVPDGSIDMKSALFQIMLYTLHKYHIILIPKDSTTNKISLLIHTEWRIYASTK